MEDKSEKTKVQEPEKNTEVTAVDTKDSDLKKYLTKVDSRVKTKVRSV